MEHNPPKENRLAGLQVLRFCAAALVLWAHAKFVVQSHTNPFMETAFGAIGVDVFFVISGFVIALTTSKPGMTWRLFLAQRVARVVPVYYFFIGVTVLVRLHNYVQFHREVGWWNTVFFIPLFDHSYYVAGVHAFGWTLSYEMWFYAVFGAALFLFRPNRAWLVVSLFLAVGAVAIFPFYTLGWYMPRFAFHPIVLEFCGGCLLFHFRHRLKGAVFAGLLCALPVFGYYAVLHEKLGWHMDVLGNVSLGFQRAGIWGGFAICLVGCVVGMDLSGKVKFPRWLALLGDASYSIYLIQPLTIWFLQRFVSGVGDVVQCVVYVSLAVFGGLLVHLTIEKSLCLNTRRFLERLVRQPLPKIAEGKASPLQR